MRRIITALLFLALVGTLLGAVPALAQDDDSGAQVNIVEPDSQPPQAWTYDPNDLTVDAGTTITWTNTGAVAHTSPLTMGRHSTPGMWIPRRRSASA